MIASVVRLWSDGKLVPRWQIGQLKPVCGELRLEEGRDDHLNRYQRTARLLDAQGPLNQRRGELILPLVDAAVLWIKDKRMTISGFERSDMNATYAQTWLIEISSTEDNIEEAT